jgi:hypothetical protein
MDQGVAGLLRDKTRPSRIPPLGVLYPPPTGKIWVIVQ